MEEKRDKNDVSRRDFIKATGATTAGMVAGSLIAKDAQAAPQAPAINSARNRIIGANDRINYGMIGVGGMGMGHLRILVDMKDQENVSVLSVCDVFEKRKLAAKEKAQVPDNQVYGDYRRLLENRDVDVVVIATPDHWHGRMSVDAMNAGKHVYVEKPMTRNFDEALEMWKVAKKTGKLVQVGSQGCSDPKWLKAREVVQSGRMGKVLWAQGSYCRNNPKGEWNYPIEPEATEQTVDWKTWLGKAPKRAWSPERYFRWRKYWDYATGIIGDLWPHRLHPLMLAMNILEFPKNVSCVGGTLVDTDTGNGEPREVADTTMVTVQFPSGPMILLAGSTVNERGIEDIIRGQKSNLLFGGGKVLIQPERPFVDEVEEKDETPPDAGENHAKHQRNLMDALRNNKKPNCDIELGVRVQAIVSMAEMSYRKGKTMHYDPSGNKIRS